VKGTLECAEYGANQQAAGTCLSPSSHQMPQVCLYWVRARMIPEKNPQGEHQTAPFCPTSGRAGARKGGMVSEGGGLSEDNRWPRCPMGTEGVLQAAAS
jgi:hypothetical protein